MVRTKPEAERRMISRNSAPVTTGVVVVVGSPPFPWSGDVDGSGGEARAAVAGCKADADDDDDTDEEEGMKIRGKFELLCEDRGKRMHVDNGHLLSSLLGPSSILFC